MSTFLRGSYLTIAEYRAAPKAMRTNDLVPGGNQAQQDAQLASIIGRASGMLDNFAQQPLYARRDTQRDRVRIDEQGNFVLHPRRDRARTLDAFAWGISPGSLSALAEPIPPSQYFVEESRITVMRSSGGLSWAGSLNFLACPRNGTVFAAWSYTAGWVTTELVVDAPSAATEVAVADPTGIEPGLPLRLVNGAVQQDVVVDTTYTPGATTVPLAEPLSDDWPVGSGVSEAPDDIKEACILATSHLIKQRKGGGRVMASSATSTPDSATQMQLGSELETAKQMAQFYERKAP